MSADIATRLAQAGLHCTIVGTGRDDVDRPLDRLEDLSVLVEIKDLGETVRSDFSRELLHFLDSGEKAAAYECCACRTIVKFGSAIQFKQPYEVHFRRKPA